MKSATSERAEELAAELHQVRPLDEHNRELLQNVHPPDWVNPEPAKRYNMVVLGAGTAGLVTAAGAAGLGAKVALIESTLLGGDCLNVGCVPSKALLRCAHAAAEVRDAGEYGVRVPAETKVDFAAVMERMRRLRAKISSHDSAARFRSLGVDVFIGKGRFTGKDTVEVGGKTLRFARACIATGARAAAPPIAGLEEAGYLTNETVFSLTELPRRLAVLGAGPIGCEMAQAFARFGAEVHVIQRSGRVLPHDSAEAAARVQAALERDGVAFLFETVVGEVRAQGGTRTVVLSKGRELTVDAILVGTGRAPNVQGLGLEVAGVRYDEREGVAVDDHLRTTNPKIFAAGDICFPEKFTHMADALARIVIRNALFFGRARTSALTIPWCTYTDPELAHVGMHPQDAAKKGIALETFRIELDDVDRAVLDGESGFLEVWTQKGKDRILGATLVARHAGEMISEITLAIVAGAGLKTISGTIHPYPTQAEVIKRAGDAFMRSRLTPRVQKLFARLMAWRR